MLPVMSDKWKQCETWDGTYSFDDLLDAREMILVKNENEARNIEAKNRGD